MSNIGLFMAIVMGSGLYFTYFGGFGRDYIGIKFPYSRPRTGKKRECLEVMGNSTLKCVAATS